MADTNFNLLGKDYLNEREAAHYCGISHSHFRRHREEEGIRAIWFAGKKLYRREDLIRSIESKA